MSNLPRQWAKVEFEDICGPEAPIIYGILQPGPDTPGGVPYVRPTEIDSQGIQLHNIRRTTAEIAERYRRSTLQTNDLLLSIVGTIGKVATVPRELDGGNITQSSCRVRPDPAISDHQYLAHYLRSPDAINQYNETRLGTAVPRLNLADVRKITAPIPPLPEQRRIVAKLDRLSARSAAARDHLAHTTKLATRAKQAVLARMIDELETESVTIDKVIATLDQGWSPKCESRPSRDDQEWGVIKTTAIQPIHFDGQENKSLPASLEPRPALQIERGDVLITRAGPRNRVGIACIVKATRQKLMLCDKAYRLRVNPAAATPAYLTYVLNSPGSLRQLEELKTGISDSGLNLTQKRFKALRASFPSIPEQNATVRRIEAAFARIDRLTEEATHAAHLVDRLDERLLAKAFAGELVPQDPNDEPADALLARIRKARAAAPKPTRGRKKKAAAE